MTKTCSRCGETKATTDFATRTRSRDGLSSACKRCLAIEKASPDGRATSRRSYVKHQKKRIAAARAWAVEHPDQAAEQRRRYNLKRLYGLTPKEYGVLLASQNGGCAICGTEEPGRGHTFLPVDHNHETGAVRGLLCHDCNGAIGFLPSSDLLRAAAKYLEDHDD